MNCSYCKQPIGEDEERVTKYNVWYHPGCLRQDMAMAEGVRSSAENMRRLTELEDKGKL